MASPPDLWGDAAGFGCRCSWRLPLRRLEGGWLEFGRWLLLDWSFLLEECLLLEDCLRLDDSLLLDCDYWLLRETLLRWSANEFTNIIR